MNIGKRQSVNVKDIWKREIDFSNWLVTQEGLELIEQDLEVVMENPRRESRPGDYSCDIVGHALGNEEHVIAIENQWGKTDHDHLGKLLTYAAVHQAMTGIWIAEHASDDHRQVIDWLNQNTPPTVSLYLAEIKAYHIGDSAAAPQFDVVCRPNLTVKLTHSGQTESERERHAWRVTFWEDIHSEIRKRKPPFNLQKASQEHWNSISIGRSNFHLNMLLTPGNQSVAVELTFDPVGWKNFAFTTLLSQKDAIESQIGQELQWREMSDKKSSRILLEEPLDPKDQSNRTKIINWFAEYTVKFYGAFRQPVLALKAPGE